MSIDFPNGFSSWMETYFEITTSIAPYLEQRPIGAYSGPQIIQDISRIYGRYALADLARDWTNEFENKNKGRVWDGEWADELTEFINIKLKQ